MTSWTRTQRSKNQDPSSREIQRSKFRQLGKLEFGAWIFSGSWILVLGCWLSPSLLVRRWRRLQGHTAICFGRCAKSHNHVVHFTAFEGKGHPKRRVIHGFKTAREFLTLGRFAIGFEQLVAC